MWLVEVVLNRIFVALQRGRWGAKALGSKFMNYRISFLMLLIFCLNG